MKKIRFKIILLILMLLKWGLFISYSQDSCKVLKPEISEKYNGGCKKGLAQGKGIAEGIDKYEGNFRKGLPDGNGKYIWANGDVYNGEWKSGMRNGEGGYTFKVNGKDSIRYGIWENDTFIKIAIPNPYKIYSSRNVDRYTITKTGDGNKITLELKMLGKDNLNVSNFDFFADNGNYREVGKYYTYENVKFPVVLKINYVTNGKIDFSPQNTIAAVFEVTINEPGDWEITLNN